ncbi:serine protease inhibitor Kazal-type 9 [Sarcophilus harrisii]
MKVAAVCLFLMLTLAIILTAESSSGETVDCRTYERLPPKDPPSCPRNFRPICGSDGITYANTCLFCHAAMKSDGNLKSKHRGPC